MCSSMYGTAGNKKQQKRVEPCIDQWPSLDFECNGSYRSEKLNLVYAFPCFPYAFPSFSMHNCLPRYYGESSCKLILKWIVVYMLITVLFTDRNKSFAYWLACSLLTLIG